jgi:deazaflavin-dependent oxidoreductase (nitroreductase family)
MSQEQFLFPQLLPYPENCLVKKLYQTPTLLYRLGLGKLFGNYVLILSTLGRKTQKTHRTPLEYFLHEGRYYIISGFGEQTDWYKNISASPLVTLQNGYERICAEARPPQTDDEWEAVYLYLTRSPIGRLLMVDHFEDFQEADIMDAIQQLPVLTFDPTDKPCPPALEADLVWAWPLILLGAAFDITTLWLLCRRKKHSRSKLK